MITINDKVYRNLQEQVLKNQADISHIIENSEILNDFGIKVVGQAENAVDLPDPAAYVGAYGDAFLIGALPPYDYYIFTRPFAGEYSPQWFNIGKFPLPGPQGPAGVVTQGDRGDRGSVWYVGTVNPDMFSPAVNEQQVFKSQDMYLNSTTGNVSQYNGNAWVPKGNLLGPAGANGQKGQRGSQWFYGTQQPGQGGVSSNITLYKGDLYLQSNGLIWQWGGNGWIRLTNITGPEGPQGQPSTAVTIVSELDSVDQLPAPTQSIRNNAYIIDINGVYHLYVITQVSNEDTTLQWTDMGPHGGTQVFANGEPIDIFNADTKLDKITTNTGYTRFYAIGPAGSQITYRVGASTFEANTVGVRTSTGTLRGATPTDNNDLTTKKYVDDAVANAGGGAGGGPALKSMSIKLSKTWLDNANLAWTTKPGYGPPSQVPAVTIDNENGVIIFGGAYSSAGMGKWGTGLSYPEGNLNYYFSMEPICGNNVGGLSTSDDRILCRSYIDLTEVVETNEFGIIYSGTLYYFA